MRTDGSLDWKQLWKFLMVIGDAKVAAVDDGLGGKRRQNKKRVVITDQGVSTKTQRYQSRTRGYTNALLLISTVDPVKRLHSLGHLARSTVL